MSRRGLAPSTVRVHLFALKFLFLNTLQRDWSLLKLYRIKKTKRLPIVLSRTEVWRLLDHLRRPDLRMCATLLYACGLRVSEAARLRVEDLDGQRMVLWVRRGKGDKDRQVPLPTRTLQSLRQYWRDRRPPQPWLFPDSTGKAPISRNRIDRAIRAAQRQSGIRKGVSCHTLRHSYATHLLEHGADPQLRTMTLSASEFIRRFLQHVLPDGFHKVRYYGLWAPAHRKHLQRLQDELSPHEPPADCLEQADSLPTDRHDHSENPTPGEPLRCPQCHEGRLYRVARIPPGSRDPPHD